MLDLARSARDLAVGDVANEHVAEGVLGLARDGGAPLAADELLALERVQALLDCPALAPAERRERAEPEDLADDGGVLEQLLLLGREQRRAARR